MIITRAPPPRLWALLVLPLVVWVGAATACTRGRARIGVAREL